MRTFIAMLMTFVCWTSMYGQSSSAEAIKQINAIKLNKEYITAESTAETYESSYENARALLEINIEEWIKSTTSATDLQGYIAKSGNSVLELKSMRGNRYRTFLYVKKKDVMTFSEPKDIIVAHIEDEYPQQTLVEDSPNEIAEDSCDDKEREHEDIYQPTDEEKWMLEVDRSVMIESFIKGNHSISAYGKFKDIPPSGDCYLFVYNREGEIPAVLLRNKDGYRNVRTGEYDDIANYKGCGAIWFRYNK